MQAFSSKDDLRNWWKKLKKYPNVVGIDGNLRARIKDGIENPDIQCIRIYVSKKIPITQFKSLSITEHFFSFLFRKHNPLSKKDLLPSHINGIPVDVVEIGKIVAKEEIIASRPLPPGKRSVSKRYRPLFAGTSSTHYLSTACTLNCLFRDKETGKLLLSSNMHCFVDGTKVLSNPSFVNLENSKSVLGITGYTKVKEHFSREYNGEVIQINFRGKRITCTPEHPILVVKPCKKYSYTYREYPKYDLKRKEWILAEDLEKFDLLLIPKIPDHGRDLDPLFAKWIGFYLAEGSVCTSKSSKSVRLVNFSYDKLTPYLKLFGGKITQEERDEGILYRLIINNTQLANWILRTIGKEKRIPEFIMKSSAKSKKEFLEGFIEGDGHRRRNETIIFSKSEKLINDFYALLLSLNIVPSFWTQEQTHNYKGYQWTSKMYILSWNENPKVYEDSEFIYVPVYDIKRLSYKGIVRNIETEDNTYCIPFIVHNCFGRENKANVGDPILQPSPYDGGTLSDQIGEYYRGVEIKFNDFSCPFRNFFHKFFRFFKKEVLNTVDISFATFKCDYCEVCDPIKNLCGARVYSLGTITGKREAMLNDTVVKVGRTTGKTQGKVVSTNWTGSVQYSRGTASFTDCILVEGEGFSAGGDSGAPVLSLDNEYLGALFAGSDKYTIVCKVKNMENEGNVELVIPNKIVKRKK